MKKRIKPLRQTEILKFIREDNDRPSDEQVGVATILANVQVSEYQKKRYFVLFSNFYEQLMTDILFPSGGINPLKISQAKASI